jgi:DNA-binding NtrC family response regulator
LQKILAADQRMREGLPPVLIQGETGTGKTALARWLHEHGPRAGRELVEVNCSALPETLAESELFGHERGAFTDARTARMGLFEAANGSTLFLDELPSLSPALQAKVLTAIEDRKIRRVGGNKPIPVDVRILAATQRDLKELAAAGQFREDLFHRLDLYRVAIPPLRERGEDIVQLAEWFLARLSQRHRLPKRRLSDVGRQRLLAYHWPGNVRELAHELERALVFEESDELSFAHLGGSLAVAAPAVPATGEPDWLNPAFRLPEQGFSLDEAINRLMHLALAQTDGNVSAAARLLGVPRDFVRYRLGLKSRKAGEN